MGKRPKRAAVESPSLSRLVSLWFVVPLVRASLGVSRPVHRLMNLPEPIVNFIPSRKTLVDSGSFAVSITSGGMVRPTVPYKGDAGD
jgi:hypothetical protein